MLVVLPRHAGDGILHSKTHTTGGDLRITIVVTDCPYAVRIMRLDALLRSQAAAETHKCPWRGLIDDYGGRLCRHWGGVSLHYVAAIGIWW